MRDLQAELFGHILRARQFVYEIASPTPLERLDLDDPNEVYVKREDLSPIHAYKWRGAYYCMSCLTPEEAARGVYCASAGNHAQGVAVAARRMGILARIYMPISTPRMKVLAVRRHGGDAVEIVLHGDSFDDARLEAQRVEATTGRVFIHPYDDMRTMGGQGTLADEIVMSGKGPWDVAYLQIGGGGMAAAVSCWLRHFYPNIEIIGVEGVNQASMQAAMDAGHPVDLPYTDVFADGTALRRAGDLTYPICRQNIDRFIQVTNEELCAAIQLMWEANRCIPEPAGAMGLAGYLKERTLHTGKRILTVLCGANMDFGQLAWIARHAGIGARRRRYYRFHTIERPRSLLALIENAMDGIAIIEFQYGKVDPDHSYPVIGFEATPMELDLIDRRLADIAMPHLDVTSQEDVEFRMLHYNPRLFSNPWFLTLEFPERAGALRDFLRAAPPDANLCYFNYVYTGERVGRALIGFEFPTPEAGERFRQGLVNSKWSWREVPPAVQQRFVQ